ncbi:hypothetical protein N0V83_010993 [Neocucurbitaria cava]|uniref:Uncharacterized protein n=1 Tax=Neocucurbitaria cava TaxID=798079 RepID=A0A9W8XY46_9PLEO|nr:hypothetical protein N0V83_010993 [Neocucurbitaria cava]
MPPPPWEAWKVSYALPDQLEEYTNETGYTTNAFLFEVCHHFEGWDPKNWECKFNTEEEMIEMKKRAIFRMPGMRAACGHPDSYLIQELASWWVNSKTGEVYHELQGDEETDIQLGLYCSILHNAKKILKDSLNQGKLRSLISLEKARQHEEDLNKSLQEIDFLREKGPHGLRAVDINNMLRARPKKPGDKDNNTKKYIEEPDTTEEDDHERLGKRGDDEKEGSKGKGKERSPMS